MCVKNVRQGVSPCLRKHHFKRLGHEMDMEGYSDEKYNAESKKLLAMLRENQELCRNLSDDVLCAVEQICFIGRFVSAYPISYSDYYQHIAVCEGLDETLEADFVKCGLQITGFQLNNQELKDAWGECSDALHDLIATRLIEQCPTLNEKIYIIS